jgi:flagellar basal body-associated protein FliL
MSEQTCNQAVNALLRAEVERRDVEIRQAIMQRIKQRNPDDTREGTGRYGNMIITITICPW